MPRLRRRSDSLLTAAVGVQGRSTRQRRLIQAAFDDASRPLSLDEVLAVARRDRNSVSLSTVYRFVRALVDDGSLIAFEVPGQGAFYELAGKAHHHHFVCLRCKRVYELDDCFAPERVKVPAGFRAVAHEISVLGTCAECTPRARGNRVRARG